MPPLDDSPERNPVLEGRARELFEESRRTTYERTDRLFSVLMVIQWLAGIAAAILISPRTWAGALSQTHIHVIAAVFLGGAIVALPVLLAVLRPGTPATRHVIAAGQMLTSALLIHLSGGRIETHFHVFGSLAFLAFYRDWRVLVTASAVIATDHLLRGMFWPQSVYGVLSATPWRALEHAGWVIFEDCVLFVSIRDSVRAMRDAAERRARLELSHDLVERQVQDRTRELESSQEMLRATADFLREIYRTMPGALVVFDRRGRIKAVNESASELLEYSESELMGQPAELIFDPKDAPDFAEIDALAARREVLRAERTCRTKSGAAVPVLLSATTGVAGSGHGVSGVVCIALDIRERKKLEIGLRQAQKLESVGRLAAGIAHEINTPVQFVSDSVHFVRDAVRDLTGLIGSYRDVHRAVAEGAPPAEAAARAARAEEEADLPYLLENVPKALDRSLDGLARVATIVRSMKEFAHPDQKEMSSVDLNQAILSTLTIAKNEYKYVADVETDLGEIPPVTCHAGDVNQAVLNIVVNAAHAIADAVEGSDRRGRITVRTAREGERVVIAIGDTGGGILETIRDRIFDPFFTTKEVGRGTGQGLAIARSVVLEKHGGDLTFETEIGKGTTFFIRLPVDGKGSTALARAA